MAEKVELTIKIDASIKEALVKAAEHADVPVDRFVENSVTVGLSDYYANNPELGEFEG